MKDSFATSYEAVAASQSAQVLGGAGAKGDYLERLIVTVTTSATGTVSLGDGADTTMPITAANTPIGVYSIAVGARSRTGAWKVTTGAGATVVAVGHFVGAA